MAMELLPASGAIYGRLALCLWLMACVLGAPSLTAAAERAPSPISAASEKQAATQQSLTFISVPDVPRNVVASLGQDRDGFIWLGTGDGLARYDGYRLQMIERDGPDALSRNMGWVRALAAGPDGRLWIGTESAGLAVYDPDTRRIRVLGGPLPDDQASIISLTVDAQGHVWVGTVGSGVMRFVESAGRFEPLALPGQPPGQGQGLALASGADGSVWVGHRRGLARWRPGATALEAVQPPVRPEQPSSDPVQALLATPDGALWLGTQSGQLGHLRADGLFEWLPPAGRGAVQTLALDAEGRLWVGHQIGLDLLDAEHHALLQRVVHRPDQPAGLAGNDIVQIMRDRAGAMWVGGFGVGLQRHHSSAAIAVRGADADPESPLHDPDVRALLTLRDQRVLAATQSGRVAVLDEQLRVRSELPHRGAPVEAMAEDASGRIWLAAGGHVQQRDRDGRLLKQWEISAGAATILFADTDGTMWLGAEQGLLRLRPRDAGFQVMSDADGGLLVGREVFDIASDRAGGLWVGGRAGLYYLPSGGSILRRVDAAPGHALGFPLVLGLLYDRTGTLWVDTPVAGLHRMAGRDAQGRPRFERISVRHGKVGRPFGANLHQDAQGRIWSQAFVYDPAADRLTELRPADGAQFGTPWFRSHTQLADGRMLFGGSRGLMQVLPEAFEPSRDQPPLVLSALRVNGLPHQPRSLREGLVLPPGTRSFGVEFAALDFADPPLLSYRYRLLGYDSDWLPSDASFRSPSYSELPPGQYTLEVEATNRSGVWSPSTLRLPVTVQPQWWQARWAPWALGLMAVITVWGWVRLRTTQLRQRQAKLEALVRERTADLLNVSLTDPLTGLRNRRYLTQRIEDDLKLARRQHLQNPGRTDADILIFLVDLDHFKDINDRHGHAAGDAVLANTALTLRSVFRDSDTLVRWGGEEFLVIARGSNREHAGELAERLRQELQRQETQSPAPSAETIAVTASIGFVAYPPDRTDPDGWSWDAVLQLTDAALYAAKSCGRNGWVGIVSSSSHIANSGNASHWMRHPDTVIRQSGDIVSTFVERHREI